MAGVVRSTGCLLEAMEVSDVWAYRMKRRSPLCKGMSEIQGWEASCDGGGCVQAFGAHSGGKLVEEEPYIAWK